MADLSEENLAEMIALLRPAPDGWVQSAIELPRARQAIDQLIIAARQDRQARQAILDDLAEALRGQGVEPQRELLEQLRVRLSRLEE
jgi:hypothetical protein